MVFVEKQGTIRKVVDYDDAKVQEDKLSMFGGLRNRAGLTPTGKKYDNPALATDEEIKHNVVLGAEEKYVLNPASDETIEHLENTINEVIDNYDIDGIHFDDYFYPYTASYTTVGTNPDYKGLSFSTEPNIDYADYQAYKKAGGALSLYNWRRENINKLIKTLSDIIREANITKERPCAFGISPSGRWAPSYESCPAGSERPAEGGMKGSCGNYYSYSDLYADTKKWVEEEWIDYLVPQSYTSLNEGYIDIMEWWSDVIANKKTKLYAGTGIYLTDQWKDNLEVMYQIRYNQSENLNVDGYILYNYTSITPNKAGEKAINNVKKVVWKTNALTPLYEGYTYKHTVSANSTISTIQKQSDVLYEISYTKVDDAKAYAIYKLPNGDINDMSNYTGENLVGMALHANTNIIVDKYDPTIKYGFVTISQDNTIYPGEEVNFANAVVDEAPIVKINNLEKEYLVGNSVTFELELNDKENQPMDVLVVVVAGGKEYNVRNTQLENGKIVLRWSNPFNSAVRGLYIKATVSDGNTVVEYKSETFNIVTECSVHKYSEATCVDPKICSVCDHVEGEPLGHNYLPATTEAPQTCSRCGETVGSPIVIQPQPSKKGCKKNNTVIYTMSILSSLLLVMGIRRKEK